MNNKQKRAGFTIGIWAQPFCLPAFPGAGSLLRSHADKPAPLYFLRKVNIMPMSFPNMESLKMAGEVHKFRKPNQGESEEDYRKALALHVRHIDRIESFEIQFGVGWDEWTADQKIDNKLPTCEWAKTAGHEDSFNKAPRLRGLSEARLKS